MKLKPFRWVWTALLFSSGLHLSAQTKLGADLDGEAAQDRSGSSISLSSDGSRIAIGAPQNDGTGTNAGHVRVYEWNSSTSSWSQIGADIDGEAAQDRFGSSVAISADGQWLAVGAPENDGTASNAGHVRVFQWNSGTSSWVQRGADIDGEAGSDQSGGSVSISSDGARVIIGAINNDGTGNNAGHARVYQWNSGTSSWVKIGADIDGEAAGDNYGGSVAISSDGQRIAIGAINNDGVGSSAGHTRIFMWNSGTSAWVQMGADIDGEAAGDNSGRSVTLSSNGNRVAIGAELNDGNGASAGQVRVYDWNSGTSSWVQTGADIDGELAGDQSGFTVSLSSDGNLLAVGAPQNDGFANNAGHGRVYRWNSTSSTWVQFGTDIEGEAGNDNAGTAIAISANGLRLGLGAPANNGTATSAGHARVFDLTSFCTLSISNQPSNQAVFVNDNATFSVTSSATGAAFQWQINTGSGWTNLTASAKYSGVNTSSLSVNNTTLAESGHQFRCVLSEIICSATSNAATLTVTCGLAVSSEPGNSSIAVNTSTAFIFSSNSGTAAIQWQINTGSGWSNLSNGGIYAGANNDTLTITAAQLADNNTQLRAIINEYGCADTTTVVNLEVFCALAVTTQPQPSAVPVNSDASFVFAVNSGTAAIQWQINTGSGWSDISNTGQFSGSNNDTLQISGTSLSNNNSQFRVIVNEFGCSDTSDVVALEVFCTLAVTAEPTNVSVIAGTDDEVVFASNSGTAAIQWQINSGSGWTNLSNGGIYSGADNDTLSITAAQLSDDNTLLRAIISEYGCADTTTEATLDVYCDIAITSQPTNTTVSLDLNAVFTVGVNKTANTTYQWQINTGSGWSDLTDGGQITGSNNDTLTVSVIDLNNEGQQFRVVVSEFACSETSNAASITVRTCETNAVTWDGGGSNGRFFTRQNWVGNLCPCAGASIVFNATGNNTQNCILDSSITLGTVKLLRGYRGRLIVQGTGVVLTADSLISTAPMATFMPETGTSPVGVVQVSNNGVVNCASNGGMNIGTLNLGAAGFIQFRTRSTVNIGQLNMDEYAQFKSPQNGRVFLSGNMNTAKRITFDPAGSTFHFNGNAAQTFHFSVGTGAAGSNGAVRFWNVELNKSNTSSAGTDNLSGTDNTDTLVVLNKLTTRLGDWLGGANVKIEDTLNLLGVGNDGHSATFRMVGTKNMDVFTNNGTTNPAGTWTLSVEAENPNRIVRVWKGTANSINLGSGVVNVVTGKLRFDEDIEATINEVVTVTSTGQIVAPSTKRLTIGKYWNIAGRNTFEPRNGEVYITGSSTSSWNHGNSPVFFYDLTVNAPNQSHTWGVSSNDTIWVLNNINIQEGSPRSAVVVFEGNLTTGANADPRMDEFVASGNKAQTIKLGGADQIEEDHLTINKTADNVSLDADMDMRRLTLKNGKVLPGSNKLTMTYTNNLGNGIAGGNSNSYVDGKVYINTNSAWAGSKFRVPVGNGSKYRPITLHNSSDVNTWMVEFIDQDANTLGTSPSFNGTLDAVTTDGYWVANRSAGANNLFSDASYFEISDAGKGSWANADLIVASFNGAGNSWDDLGGAYTSNAVISTANTLRSNADFTIALGVNNLQPAGIVNGTMVSGNEIRTQQQTAGSQIKSAASVNFTVYPNPVNTVLNLNLSGSDKGMITLCDFSGKVIGTFNATETKSIDVRNLSAGVYFVNYTDGINRITHRVIRN